MSQSPEPPPAPPSGNRGLAAALAVVLGVGFVTCVYSSIQAVKALIVARSDLQVVTVIRDADRTLVEVLQENIQGKADTDTAVQRLDGSTKNLDPDLLQDLVEKNAEVLALLDAPSGELTKTRSTNQIPLLAQTLRAVGSTLLPTIQDPALKSNTREYTFRSRDGNTGSKADQELEQVVEGAKSLYSSARARLLVSLSGALIIFLALGYLGWRRWGPFRASRHRLRRSLSRQPKHEEEPTAPPPEPISPPKTAPPDLVPSFSAPAKPPRPSRPQFDATTADTDTPDTGSQARPQPTPAGPPPRKPLRFRETEDTTLNVATVRPAAPRALRPSSAPRLPDIPLLAGTSIERPLTPTPTPTPVPAPIPVRTAAPPRPVQPVRPVQPIRPVQPVQPSVPTRVAAPQRPAPSNAVAAAEVLRRAAAHLPSPHPVQWTIDTQGWVPTVQAPSVAHVVTALVEASAVKSEGRPVLVSARTWPGRLVVTISDRAEISLGELALGPQPQAVQTLIRQINAALVATPVANGQGTSTVLTVPIPPGMD